MASSLEFRVVVSKAGIKSVDHYFDIERALKREEELKARHKNVVTQQRTVTEWENVSPR